MNPSRGLALTAAVTMLLAGCVPTPGHDDASSTQDTEDLGTLTGAGRPMDSATLMAALPAANDLGEGWAEADDDFAEAVKADEVNPARCAQLFGAGPGWDELESSQRGEADIGFDVTGGLRTQIPDHVTVDADSYDQPQPSQRFDEMGRAVADCTNFTMRDTNGEPTPYQAQPLAFPQLGDRTVAFRLTVHITDDKQSFTAAMDSVAVKIGHNIISATHVSLEGAPDTTVTEAAVRTTLEGMEGR